MTEFRCKPSNLSRSRSLRAFCAASITLRFSSTLIDSPPPSLKALGTLNAPLLGSHPGSRIHVPPYNRLHGAFAGKKHTLDAPTKPLEFVRVCDDSGRPSEGNRSDDRIKCLL